MLSEGCRFSAVGLIQFLSVETGLESAGCGAFIAPIEDGRGAVGVSVYGCGVVTCGVFFGAIVLAISVFFCF